MKKASKIFKRMLAAGFFPLLALGSCISEKEIYTPSGDGDTEITFSIMLPGKSAPASRGMDDEKENKVEYMDILAFEPGGNYVYTARCSGADITTDGGNIRKKTFTVKLRQGTYDLVLLANARDMTAVSGMFSGKDREAALALIEAEMPISGKWPVDGSRPIPMWGEKSNVTINESTNLTGTNGISLARMVARVDVQITGAAVGKFELRSVHVYNYNTRGSIAPLSGQWDTSVPETPKATAPNVPASSTLTKGPLKYEGATVTTTGCASEIYIFEAENHTTTAHTTANAQLLRTCIVIGGVYDANGDSNFTNDGEPTYYRVDFSTGTGASPTYLDVLRNHQYIFSVTKVSGVGYETADIAFESGPVNIEANVLEWNDSEMGEIIFNGQNYMSVSPTEFDLHRNAKTGLTFSVKTDYAQGWTFAGVTDSPKDGAAVTWIKNVSPISGAGNDTKQTVTFDVDLNDTGVKRTAYIHIKAGDRLTFPVEVTQSTEMELALGVLNATGTDEISELVFWSSGDIPTQPAAQSFTLRWAPETENVSIVTLPVGASSAFDFDGSVGYFNASTSSATGGSQTFSVQPTTIGIVGDNKFPERISLVNFTLSSQGRSTSKSLFLRHIYYNLIPQPGTFLMNGTEQTFRVLANFQWRVEFVSATEDDQTGDSDRIKDVFAVQYGGNNTDEGDPVKFTCFDYISEYAAANPQKGKITMKFSRLDPVAGWVDWDTHEITCYAAVPVGESNCYMINNANPVPILIPISQIGYAMGSAVSPVSGFLGSGWISDFSKLKAQVLWSDVNKLNGEDDAVVKVVTYNGGTSLEEGMIVIVPGGGIGNAGIILYEDNDGTEGYKYSITGTPDRIVWSWHIWNSTYFPYVDDTYPSTNPTAKGTTESGGVWMDRNIGATTNTYVVNDPQKVAGFFYQWGRKDPLPSINQWDVFFTNYLYYAPGSDMIYREVQNLTNQNLTNSVMNPMTHYWLSALPNDWYTNVTANQNNDLWGGGADVDFLHSAGIDGNRKSVYDPCPEGYRVPLKDEWISTGWGASTSGRIHANFGGYYPATGHKNGSSIGLSKVNMQGNYWQATPFGTYGYYIYLPSSGNVNSIDLASRATGMSVRCRAE